MAISWVGVVLASIFTMVIGAVWYGPLFGKEWKKAMDVSEKDVVEKGMWKLYAIAFVNSLMMMMVLALFVSLSAGDSMTGALQIGFWIWFGFLLTQQISAFVWSKNHNALLLLINGGYWLIVALGSAFFVSVF